MSFIVSLFFHPGDNINKISFVIPYLLSFIFSDKVSIDCLQYLLFQSYHPSKYLTGSLLLNFSNLAGTSALGITRW